MSQSKELPPHIKKLFDDLSSLPTPEQCPKCGSKLMHMETTFFSLGEQFWTVPLACLPDLRSERRHGKVYSAPRLLAIALRASAGLLSAPLGY
jgi:hypothetical protein